MEIVGNVFALKSVAVLFKWKRIKNAYSLTRRLYNWSPRPYINFAKTIVLGNFNETDSS